MSRRASTDASRDRRATPRTWRRRFRVGEHNLHDRAGVPVFVGAVMLFTEAIPSTIRARAVRVVKVGTARVRGIRVIVCREQPDLVIAVRRWLFVVESVEYRLAHPGEAGVTPHRGTFVVRGRLRFTPIKVALLVEHRINSWWKNERGEQTFRATCWHTHTDLTVGWVVELERAGYVVIAGGDLNAPEDVRGYDGALQELSTSLDRVACSRVVHADDVTARAHLSDFERGPRRESDHHEISAAATVTATERKAAA